MAPKRKAKQGSEITSPEHKKTKQEKPRAKTPIKPRSKTPVKDLPVENPKPRTPAKPRTKTPSKITPTAKKVTSVSRIPADSLDVSGLQHRRSKEWKEKAALVLREHLEQINQQSSTTKIPPATSTCNRATGSSYLQAYYALPTLKHRDELPSCYFRACIFDGYRDQWTWHETTVSLFSMHNETMCIWSHLLPLLCGLVGAGWLGLQMQADGSTVVEQLMMGIFVFTACSCLLLSSVYHWYGCMSEDHYFCLLAMDLGGIACLIAGSFFPGVYYGFYCTPLLQRIYIGVTCLILVMGLVVSVLGASKSPSAALIRQGGFASLTIFGFVPLCHWLLIAPSQYKDQMTLGALGMFFFYGLGFSFLLTSFPESVWRNNYVTTYLIPSHSLWHLGVAAAICTWFLALLGQQQLIRDIGCQPFDDYINEFNMGSYAF